MRVLHLQKVAGIGGSERHLMELLPAMRKSGIEASMLMLRAGDSSVLADALRRDGVDTREIIAGPDLNPVLLPRLGRSVRELSPDLLHTHLIHADIYGQLVAWLSRTPAVLTLHSAIFEFWSAGARELMRIAARKAMKVIAISNNVARAVERTGLAPREKVTVIPYGIDTRDWLFADTERAEARRRFGWASGDLVVGAASRLIPLKGHDFLMDAFAEAAPRIDRGRLAIAGDGPSRRELEMRGASLDVPVHFLGHVSDVKGFMNACDIMVFPTLRGLGEGFGLAALEAMAASRATVVTKVDSLPELVEHDRSGLLVEPGEVSLLAEVLVQLAAHPERRRALGLTAREVVTTRFTRESMVDRTLEVYREVLGSSL